MPTFWRMRHPDFYDKPNTACAILWALLALSSAGAGLVCAQLLEFILGFHL